jgi:hypothetical protein
MATSTLDPDNMPESDRQLGKGHGIDSLGPSDISDTGSDVQGGFRAIEEFDLGLDRGTTEDSDSHTIDVSRDTDDSTGTGESSTAGRNSDIELGGDIGVDRIDYINPEDDPDFDFEVSDSDKQRRQQQHKH